jgi:hypothetical protein
MKTLIESYSALKEEVENFRNLVLQMIEKNPTAEKLYKGCTILYSPLHENPEIMFIGINPGAGFYKKSGIKIREDIDLEPTDSFEYLDYVDDVENDYKIASETREVFERANLYHLLEKCVKTNYFYFITSGERDLDKLFLSLGDEMYLKFHLLAQKWTKEMIEMVNPKIIICEGKSAFVKIKDIYSISPTWNNSIGYFESPNKTMIVGYKRRYSNIQDKNELIDLLKKEITSRLK